MTTATKEKTKEQIALEAKKKLFEENPEDFIHMGSIIPATYITEGRINFVLGRTSRQNLLMAQAEINFQITAALAQIEVERAKKRAANKPIIVPNGKIH